MPKGADPDAFPLDQAIALLAAQKAKGKTRRPARGTPMRKVASAAGNGGARNGATKPAPRPAAKRTTAVRGTVKAKGKPAAKPKPAARAARRPPA